MIRPAAALALAALLALPTPLGHADGSPAQRALGWLAAHREPGGGFGEKDDGVGAAYVVEAVAAAGLDPKLWPSPDASAYAQMDRESTATTAARTLHAASVSGYERADLVATLRKSYHDGTFDRPDGGPPSPAWDAFAILALRASGAAQDDAAIAATAQRLMGGRSAQGGWGTTYSPAAASDVDITGMALAALADAGVDVRGDTRAALFLNATHASTGGHAETLTLGGGANTQSTVWALDAYRLLDASPFADDEPWLLAQQRSDGSFPHDPANGANAWATAEVAAYLAGARYPLAGIVPPALASPHALDITTLELPSDYASARWTFEDGSVAEGTRAQHAFAGAGVATLQLDARGPHAIHRGATNLTVLSARPVIVAPADVSALRNVPVALDVASSYDPDGAIVAWSADWGDGNASQGTQHAYALPGDYAATLRARDDAGGWSDPARVTVHVVDRAPVLSGLPARVVADRVAPLALSPDASDPDGDALTLAWTLDGVAASPPPFRFAALGERVLTLAASDPFGLAAWANVTVDVRDLPPALALDVPARAREGNVTLRANATDADGPAPRVSWRVDDATLAGANVTVRLAAGAHHVLAMATDADGATANASADIMVLAPDAPAPAPSANDEPRAPTPAHAAPARAAATAASAPAAAAALAPPVLHAPARAIAGEPARVTVDADENASVTLELGDGARVVGREATHAWALPGDYELRATETAPDGSAASATLVLHVDAAPPASARAIALNASAEATAGPPPASAPPPPPGQALHALQGGPTRQAPLPWPLAAAALLGAALGTRARRGRR